MPIALYESDFTVSMDGFIFVCVIFHKGAFILRSDLMHKIKELADNLNSSVNTFPESMISALFDQCRVTHIFYAPDVNKVKEILQIIFSDRGDDLR